jgi:hypothetical protein
VTAYANVLADGTVNAAGSLNIVTADVRKPPATVGTYCFTGLPAGTVNAVAATAVWPGNDRLAQTRVAASGGFPGGCAFGETALVTTYDVSAGGLVDSEFNVVFYG